MKIQNNNFLPWLRSGFQIAIVIVCAAIAYGASRTSADAAREIVETRTDIKVNTTKIEHHDKQLAELKEISRHIRTSVETMGLDLREIKTILKRGRGEQ